MTDSNRTELRQALGQFATGVTIVTAVNGSKGPVGITANSFNSVSLDPPMVLWSLSNDSSSKDAFTSAAHFCVHVLTSDQQFLSERFACSGTDKFVDVNWTQGIGDLPLLTEFSARFQCRTAHQYPVGDHIVFVGEVLEFAMRDKRPLVFHGGRYALAERRLMTDVAREVEDRYLHASDRAQAWPKRRESDN